MKRTIEQVEKTLKNYLELDNVHYGNKLKKINNETVSTYDGTYPSFEVIYEGVTNRMNHEVQNNMIKDIERYLGLKHGTDYWLGITMEL